jgi:hypothetical protein
VSGTTTSLLTTTPPFPGAQGRVSVPATIIGTPSRGRKVTSATGVSNLWWHHDLTPRPHLRRHRARRLPPHPQVQQAAHDLGIRQPPPDSVTSTTRGTGIRKPTAYRDAFPWERVSHAEPYVARAVTAANLELSEARNRNRADMSRTNHARQRPWLVPEKGFTEGTALGIGQLMADKTASG